MLFQFSNFRWVISSHPFLLACTTQYTCRFLLASFSFSFSLGMAACTWLAISSCMFSKWGNEKNSLWYSVIRGYLCYHVLFMLWHHLLFTLFVLCMLFVLFASVQSLSAAALSGPRLGYSGGMSRTRSVMSVPSSSRKDPRVRVHTYTKHTHTVRYRLGSVLAGSMPFAGLTSKHKMQKPRMVMTYESQVRGRP